MGKDKKPRIAQQIEIRPTKELREIFEKYFHYSRYIYNKALFSWKFMYQNFIEGKSDNKPDFRRVRNMVKANKEEWEKEFSPQIIDTSCEDVTAAFNMFFKKINHYPKFRKKKKMKYTFRFYRKNINSIKVLEGNWLQLNRMPLIKLKESIRFDDLTIQTVTISRKGNKYFASFCFNSENVRYKQVKGNKYCGVDLGIKVLAMINDSDNRTFERSSIISDLKPLYEKIKIYQHILSRKLRTKPKGQEVSKKYLKAKVKLQNTYRKIDNIKKNNLHRLTSYLIRKYKYITIEDLKVNNLLKKGKRRKKKTLNRNISESLFYTFRTQLEYKAKWHGNKIIVADRFFPSSQLCSNCGNIRTGKDKLKLKDRTYICSECGNKIDRDKNAAINLKLYGMRNVG